MTIASFYTFGIFKAQISISLHLLFNQHQYLNRYDFLGWENGGRVNSLLSDRPALIAVLLTNHQAPPVCSSMKLVINIRGFKLWIAFVASHVVFKHYAMNTIDRASAFAHFAHNNCFVLGHKLSIAPWVTVPAIAKGFGALNEVVDGGFWVHVVLCFVVKFCAEQINRFR